MQPSYTPQGASSRPPTIGGLTMLVGFVLIGGVVSTLLLFGIMAVSKGIGFTEAQNYLTRLATNPSAAPGSWYELMTLQAVNHLGTFLLPALAYWYFIERRTWEQFSERPASMVAGFSLIGLIVIAFMPFDSFIIDWNRNLHLPETLAPLEQWIRDKEKGLEGITKYLTTFDTTGQLLMAILVIAVIPAIGEETLFRGILQRNLIIWTKNPHVGIWLAAALFSAIHIQFLGFFPRMLLGALFGYLYLWSGNLWVPILAHFVNNGFTVFMVYLHQKKLVSVDIETPEAIPLAGVLVSGVITLGLLIYFQKRNQERALTHGER
ncbi:hypothetical protein GCM10028818_03800 [Spirosoma horti]